MSYLEQFLKGVEVDWKTLGEVLKIKNGKDYKNFKAGNIPVYGSGGVMTFIDTYVFDKPSVLIPRKGSLRNLYYVDVPFWTVDTIFWTDINMSITEPKYVYYFLKTQHLEELNMAGGVPSLTQTILNKVSIPIPPISVQKEIIRVLDQFTELTTELTFALTTELTARKKQYNFYRGKLLTFKEDEVEWKILGEVTEIKRGRRLIKSELEQTGKYAVFQNSMTPLGYYHEKNVNADTTFIICAGSAGEMGFSKIDFWAADDVTYFVTPENLNNKFLYYYLLTQQQKILSQVRRSSVPRLSKSAFERMPIPVPSLEEQALIVSFLDKLEALITSISAGIPKEIELRKKQYEYYRDQLLTFPKHEV